MLSGHRAGRTLSTPDMDEMSSPKRPPPIHANDPTMYCRNCCQHEIPQPSDSTEHTGFEAMRALYCRSHMSITYTRIGIALRNVHLSP